MLPNRNIAYAHTPSPGSAKWHNLTEHLEEVAAAAARFAEHFGLTETARLAGLWHDAGKYSPLFQDYLQGCHADTLAEREGKPPKHKRKSPVPHAAVGALAWRAMGPLAAVIAGHHRGLYDMSKLAGYLKPQGGWAEEAAFAAAQDAAQRALGPADAAPEVTAEWTPFGKDNYACELLTRLLFSALVDADRLDTEKFWEPEKHEQRAQYPELTELLPRYTAFMEDKAQQARDDGAGSLSPVNALRAEILEKCLAAATREPGVYRLTVPTGGGKTLASLGFALRHAAAHGLRRVVMAIPYTSIIDQTAQVYRAVFKELGQSVVVEHHSALGEAAASGSSRDSDWREEEAQASDEERRRELACENWDAPLIVTTTVQLFDSLLSNKPRAMRKLHNLARSVIILDEAQTLPADMLSVYVSLLEGLVRWAGCTVVLCTATQPALDAQTYAFSGFTTGADGVMRGEIVEQPEQYFTQLRRVDYDLRVGDGHDKWGWEDVAREMLAQEQCLCILNTKKDALAVLDALEANSGGHRAADSTFDAVDGGTVDAVTQSNWYSAHGIFHLSTLLCGTHRKQVLEEVRQRLKNGLPVRLVSTQVVEAGVDLDFPLVLRALGPLDRIVQAAGRCNREGKRASGLVIVFEPGEGGIPPGEYRTARDTTRSFLAGGRDDLDMPEAHREYFRRLYQGTATHRHVGRSNTTLQDLRRSFAFEQAAQLGSLIDQGPTEGLIVRWGGGDALLDDLRSRLARGAVLNRADYRRLQQYTVNVSTRQMPSMPFVTRLIPDGLAVWDGAYDNLRGLVNKSSGADDYIV